ncbi:hypothetical protein ACFW2E_43785, partial [Streptomyces sp. NPDC058964]
MQELRVVDPRRIGPYEVLRRPRAVAFGGSPKRKQTLGGHGGGGPAAARVGRGRGGRAHGQHQAEGTHQGRQQGADT